jgi:CO/xanthine dehydrogenase Mo-binding subunit
MIRPATLGSTLISVGAVDKKQYPTAEIVKKGNLVAVVSPYEWEAIGASRAVAAGTKWTDWAGLPGSENLTKTLRTYKWDAPSESRGKVADVTTALAKATKKISASYEQPYVRHAPIGPFVAVADVRSDGSVTVWTHSAQSQGLRARIAYMLGTKPEQVVVRWLDHSGQYGRTTFGGDRIAQFVLLRPHDGSAPYRRSACWNALQRVKAGGMGRYGVAVRQNSESARRCVRNAQPWSGIGIGRTARQHHAHSWTASAEFCAGGINERSGGSSKGRFYCVSFGAHDRPAVD